MSYYSNNAFNNKGSRSIADESDNWRRKTVNPDDPIQSRGFGQKKSYNRNNGNNYKRDIKRPIISGLGHGAPLGDIYEQSNVFKNAEISSTTIPTKLLNALPQPALEPTVQVETVSNTIERLHLSNDSSAVVDKPVDNQPEPEKSSSPTKKDQRNGNANERLYKKIIEDINKENRRSTATPPPPKTWIHPDDRNSTNRKEYFQPFLKPDLIENEIKNGNLYQGIMRLSRNPQDAYVTCDDLDADIYIGGFADRNRSLQGDLVAVELVDVDPVWNARKEREAKRQQERLQKRKQQRAEQGDSVNEEEQPDDAVVEEEDLDEDGHKPKYCGKVVGILMRPTNATYAGFIMLDRFNNSNVAPGENNKPRDPPRIAWFKPTDKRVPFMILRNNDVPYDLVQNEEYYKTHLFSADIRRWQITDLSPTGGIVKEIGAVGELLTERAAIIADNNIIDAPFSDIALEGLPILPWSIPEAEIEKRRDLRNKRIFSIDPKTAKDLDDALHVNPLDDGNFEVGVHIADVSYFLKKGSALDNEARERGTSTYLVDSVIPMLPQVLCEELCSLNPGVDRLAFSVIWKLDTTGKPLDTWFGKTVIRSCAKLAYEDAQTVIDGDEIPADIKLYNGEELHSVYEDIYLLYDLSAQMRKRRYTSGSLSLQSVKLNFGLDEDGEPTSVYQFLAKEANQMIEEFMLLANISVAKKIASKYTKEALLRKHEEPLERRLNEFIKLTDSLGLDFAAYNAGALQESFDKIHNKDVKDVLLVLAIRCMQRAKYFCSGGADIFKYQHYALNEPLYTHFTSPIRRYADVLVHRLLESALENKSSCGYTQKLMRKLSFHCNSKKDGAKNAQDVNIELYLARYLSHLEKEKGPVYAQADVIMVNERQYEVYVPKYGLEKKFHVEDLPTIQHHYDKVEQTLDIFWKRGVPVTMHNEEAIYARERIRKDDYSDTEEDSSVTEDDAIVDESMVSRHHGLVENDDDLVPPVVLEENTCLQRLQMFSKIDVRLQVNMDRSPPIINIYPVNPFSGETVA